MPFSLNWIRPYFAPILDTLFQVFAWWYGQRADEHKEAAEHHRREARRITSAIASAGRWKADLVALLLVREGTEETGTAPTTWEKPCSLACGGDASPSDLCVICQWPKADHPKPENPAETEAPAEEPNKPAPKCDAPGCEAPPVLECKCRRCQSEPTPESRFYVCGAKAHRHEVNERHAVVYAAHEPRWEACA